jgi:hypothetical protein
LKTREEILAVMETLCAPEHARQVLNNMIEVGQVHVVADVSPAQLRLDPEWDGLIFALD